VIHQTVFYNYYRMRNCMFYQPFQQKVLIMWELLFTELSKSDIFEYFEFLICLSFREMMQTLCFILNQFLFILNQLIMFNQFLPSFWQYVLPFLAMFLTLIFLLDCLSFHNHLLDYIHLFYELFFENLSRSIYWK
jgi:hypothetical protein